MHLLRLPQLVQRKIIRMMSREALLSLSVCSKRVKSIVIYWKRKLKIKQIELSFGNRLEVDLFFVDEPMIKMAFMDAQNDGLRQLERPQTIQFLCGGNRVLKEWRGLSFGFGTWLRHLLLMYSCNKISNCSFKWQNDLYDVGSIKRALAGVKIQSAKYFDRLSAQNVRQLLNSEILSEYVTVCGDRFDGELGLRKFLSQNLSVFYCIQPFPSYFTCLDNILAINSRTVQMQGAYLSSKDLNQFLKLWKTGAMPRLEFLHLMFLPEVQDMNENEILRGVKHVVNPRNLQSRTEVENLSGRQSVCISGGIVITRYDGAKAIIGIKSYMFNLYLLK